MAAALSLAGPAAASAHVVLTFSTARSDARARAVGVLGGRPVALWFRVPSTPQGYHLLVPFCT